LWVLLWSPLAASTEIVLQDGQTIRGRDLQRQGDVYLVVLEGDGVLTVPVSLVKQVRWVNGDEDPRPSDDGLTRNTAPEQLAGEEVTPVSPAEALVNLPEPARFRSSVIDPNWEPRSGFGDEDVLAGSRSTFQSGVIDPLWKPSSGFPDADVLASGRSTFREAPIDPSWTPVDGFKKRALGWNTSSAQFEAAPNPFKQVIDLAPSSSPTRSDEAWERALRKGGWFRSAALKNLGEGKTFRFDPRRRGASAPSRAQGCGELTLRRIDKSSREATVKVARLKESLYEELPLRLYEAVVDSAELARRAVFTVDGDECRPLGGDLRDIMGVKLSDELRLSNGVASYNAALGYRVRVELPTERAKLDYALAVVSLTDSQVSGHRRAKMLLVEESDALTEIHARQPESCSKSKSTRRGALKSAQKKFVAPRVVRTSRGEAVELMTWSSVGGEVVKFAVFLSDDGKIAINRERVASHIGAHEDRDSPAKP